MVKKQIYFTDKQLRYLIEQKRATGLAVGELVRRIIDQHMETKEDDYAGNPVARGN